MAKPIKKGVEPSICSENKDKTGNIIDSPNIRKA